MAWLRQMWNREFDQYSSDDNYHWEIQLARFALGTTGVWSKAGRPNRIRFIIVTMMMMGIIVAELINLFPLIGTDGRRLFLYSLVAVSRILLVGCMSHLHSKSNVCHSILKLMRKNWKTNSSEDREVMHRYARFSRKIGLIIAVMRGGYTIFVDMKTLVPMVIRKGNLTTSLNGACVPLSSSNAFGLASCYAYRRITMHISMVILVGMNICLVVFVLHACAQLIILGNKIKMFEWKIRHSSEEEISSHCICLKCIVDSHTRICVFVKQIDEYLHIHIFTKIIWSIIEFCLSGFSAAEGIITRDLQRVLLGLLYAPQIVAALFSYCWAAEMCQQQSYALGDIAYATAWVKKDPKISRDLIFIILRARIPLKITGAKIFVLSLSLFKECVLTSLSYLSILQTFRQRNQGSLIP